MLVRSAVRDHLTNEELAHYLSLGLVEGHGPLARTFTNAVRELEVTQAQLANTSNELGWKEKALGEYKTALKDIEGRIHKLQAECDE